MHVVHKHSLFSCPVYGGIVRYTEANAVGVLMFCISHRRIMVAKVETCVLSTMGGRFLQ